MKELLAHARNLALVESDDKLRGVAEVITVLSEPVFAVDAAGALNRTRTTETIRFSVTARSAREFSKALTSIADEIDALEARTSLKAAK